MPASNFVFCCKYSNKKFRNDFLMNNFYSFQDIMALKVMFQESFPEVNVPSYTIFSNCSQLISKQKRHNILSMFFDILLLLITALYINWMPPYAIAAINVVYNEIMSHFCVLGHFSDLLLWVGDHRRPLCIVH